MIDIHVFFHQPLSENPAAPPPIEVRHDPMAIDSGQLIYWRFHSLHPAIRRVEVEFDDPGATYFPLDPAPTHKMSKDLDKASFIWGRAPDMPDKAAPRADKYWIRAYDAKGGTVAELDPTIITEKPRP